MGARMGLAIGLFLAAIVLAFMLNSGNGGGGQWSGGNQWNTGNQGGGGSWFGGGGESHERDDD